MLSVSKNSVFVGVAVIALLSVSSVFAAGGDGGHFNGPTLETISIPVSAERGIDATEAKQALYLCLASGNSDQGVSSLAQNLYRRVYKREAGFLTSNGGVAENETLHELYMTGIYGDRDFYLGVDQSVGKTFLQIRPYGVQSSFSSFDATTVFPKLAYESVNEDVSYDEWGNVAQSKRILKGIRIIAPSNYDQPAQFLNHSTHREIPLTIDFADTVECLQAQLQKSAI